MNPAWVVATIAAGGIVFQSGIAYLMLILTRKEVADLKRRDEVRAAEVEKIDRRVDQHDWRLKATDDRLERHDQQFHVLGGQVDRIRIGKGDA